VASRYRVRDDTHRYHLNLALDAGIGQRREHGFGFPQPPRQDAATSRHMSEGPTAADFRDVLDEYWHDRPPASLEDVMALYGVLGWLRAVGALHDPQ